MTMLRASNPLLLQDGQARVAEGFSTADDSDEETEASKAENVDTSVLEQARQVLDFVRVRSRTAPEHCGVNRTSFRLLFDIPLPKVLELQRLQAAGVSMTFSCSYKVGFQTAQLLCA